MTLWSYFDAFDTVYNTLSRILPPETGETIEDAINYAALSIEGVTGVQDVQVVGYPKPQTPMEALLESLTGETNAFAGTAFEGIADAFQEFGKQDSGKAYARMPYVITVE